MSLILRKRRGDGTIALAKKHGTGGCRRTHMYIYHSIHGIFDSSDTLPPKLHRLIQRRNRASTYANKYKIKPQHMILAPFSLARAGGLTCGAMWIILMHIAASHRALSPPPPSEFVPEEGRGHVVGSARTSNCTGGRMLLKPQRSMVVAISGMRVSSYCRYREHRRQQ